MDICCYDKRWIEYDKNKEPINMGPLRETVLEPIIKNNELIFSLDLKNFGYIKDFYLQTEHLKNIKDIGIKIMNEEQHLLSDFDFSNITNCLNNYRSDKGFRLELGFSKEAKDFFNIDHVKYKTVNLIISYVALMDDAKLLIESFDAVIDPCRSILCNTLVRQTETISLGEIKRINIDTPYHTKPTNCLFVVCKNNDGEYVRAIKSMSLHFCNSVRYERQDKYFYTDYLQSVHFDGSCYGVYILPLSPKPKEFYKIGSTCVSRMDNPTLEIEMEDDDFSDQKDHEIIIYHQIYNCLIVKMDICGYVYAK